MGGDISLGRIDDEGKFLYGLFVVSDISELKKIDDALPDDPNLGAIIYFLQETAKAKAQATAILLAGGAFASVMGIISIQALAGFLGKQDVIPTP